VRAPEPARELRVPGGGVRRFVGESWGELKKVEWPGQNQLIQGVVVVLIACLIVGIWLYAADLVFKRLVQDVFL
jgi:preprotein translocase subunit SecE